MKSGRPKSTLSFIVLLTLLLASLFTSTITLAQSSDTFFSMNKYRTFVKDKIFILDASIDITLPSTVQDALDKGVDLVFITHIQVIQPETILPDKKLLNIPVRKRLGFHPLTKKYIVEDLTFGTRKSFYSLTAALEMVGSVQNISLIDEALSQTHDNTLVRIRVELSHSDLPFPLKIRAKFSPSWYLSSNWFAWNLN